MKGDCKPRKDAPAMTVSSEALRCIVAPNASAMTNFGTNTYLVVGKTQIAVIDPGPDDDRHLESILSHTSPSCRISKIFVTHPHVDHTGLAVRLAHETGADVLAHSGASGACSKRMRKLAEEFALGGGEGIDREFEPDRRLIDGELTWCDDWSFEAVWTPGHTANHMCYAWREAGILFSGDHVMGWSTTVVSPPHGDMGDFMASLDRLMQRQDEMLLPGHGGRVLAPVAEIKAQQLHRREREAQILHVLSCGLNSVGEIAGRIYSGLPVRLAAAAERTVLAHLLDLWARERAEAFCCDGLGRPCFRLVD